MLVAAGGLVIGGQLPLDKRPVSPNRLGQLRRQRTPPAGQLRLPAFQPGHGQAPLPHQVLRSRPMAGRRRPGDSHLATPGLARWLRGQALQQPQPLLEAGQVRPQPLETLDQLAGRLEAARAVALKTRRPRRVWPQDGSTVVPLDKGAGQ